MRRIATLLFVLALTALLLACPSGTTPTTSVVTGVTIGGTGVSGTGVSKEVTVTMGTPLDLGVTLVQSGSPDVTEAWTSGDTAIATVGATTGIVSGVAVSTTGTTITVTVGGKTDSIQVKVKSATPGLTLEFATDKLEFQSIATTTPLTAGSPVSPTVVKDSTNIISLKNTDGSFKNTSPETLQGSSYLLYKTPITGNFEVKAAIKITGTGGSSTSDKYSAGVGIFTTDANGNVTLDSKAAVMSARAKPDLRSQWTKANTYSTAIPGGTMGAGSPNIATGVILSDYHLLSTKRIGNSMTFEVNGVTAPVSINTVAEGTGTATGEIWSTLAGTGKVGIVFAGVTAEVEGFTINELDASGVFVKELYSSGAMPAITFAVDSINVTGPTGSVESASIDLAGVAKTIQLSTAYVPSNATIGNSVTYTVSAGDSNVTVDAAGLVTITAIGDGSATITGTSGNNKTDTYVITITDSTVVSAISTVDGAGNKASTYDIASPPTLKLTTTYTPSGATTGASVTYSASAGNVTIAADGTVTVANASTSLVTITSTSGNGKTDSYVLTITDTTVKVAQSVSVAPTTLTIAAGQSATSALVATVLPDTATDKSVTWSSDTTGVSVVNGLVSVATGTAAGTATIKATSNQTPSAFGSCVVTITAGVDSITYFDTLSDNTALAAVTAGFGAYTKINFVNGISLQTGSSATATKTDALTTAVTIGTITATRRLSIDKYRLTDTTQLAITVPVLGNCSVKVGVARDGTRTIDATATGGTLTGTTSYPCPITPAEVAFAYTGGAGIVSINTINTGGSIYIYYIFIDYP